MEVPPPQPPMLANLLIYVTARCNLRCRHCYYYTATSPDISIPPEDEISYDQICRALDELLPLGLQACKLSGGEPFLRKDLLDICRSLDTRSIRMVMETNGTLVTRGQAEALAQLRGCELISVSIDGAAAETHEALRGVAGCFRRAWEGMEHLVAAGLKVQVIAAAYQANKSELPLIMDMAASKGAESFRVCFVNAIGRARGLPLLSLDESLEVERRLAQQAKLRGIRYCSTIPKALQSVTTILDSCAMEARCNIRSTLGILADGTITICGMGRHAREFRFGTLGEDDLAGIWIHHPTLNLIRNGIPDSLQGVCRRCVLRAACLGHCRLENETATADQLFAPFSKCAEMERRGLFPQSRLVERTQTSVNSV